MTPILTGPIEAKKTIFTILGAPGAGKTTQALRLASNLGCEHLMMSGLLREILEETDDQEFAKDIKRHMFKGHQIDSEKFYNLILDKVDADENLNVFIDGFPRTTKGCEIFKEYIANRESNLIVFHAHCPREICFERFMSKASFESAENVFRNRMKHYSDVERTVISMLSEWPIVNLDTSNTTHALGNF